MRQYTGNEKDLAVMTRRQVRAFDRWAIETAGISGAVLMENAGRSCAELIIERLKSVPKGRVCLFCGTGNNGGDGFVIARHLYNAGIEPVVVICSKAGDIKGDARANLEIIEKLPVKIEQLDISDTADIADSVNKAAAGCDMIVDAIFGTGLHGRLSSAYAELIACINHLAKDILAVDIPSGLDCDTGRPIPVCIEATMTVTFAAAKKGFTAGREIFRATGRIFVASIGIEPSDWPAFVNKRTYSIQRTGNTACRPLPAP